MYLIVGLGNPESEFNNTPHNIGFRVVDTIAKELNLNWKKVKFANGEAIKTVFQDDDVVLLKPATYMNKSGLCVISALKYWKVNINNLIVVQDDSDIELGRLKIGYNQNSGGHKGLESIIKSLKTKQFARLKIGIRPIDFPQGGKTHIKAEKFVLRKYPEEELNNIAQKGKEAILFWLKNGLEKTMSVYNQK